MALVVYTTRRSSGGNSPNGTNSSQEFRHDPIMAGQVSSQSSANWANRVWAASTVAEVQRSRAWPW